MGYDIVKGNVAYSGYDQDALDLLTVTGASHEALAQGAAILRQKVPSKAREYPLGFDSGAVIAAGLGQNITSQPQVIFRAERLVVPSDIGGSFTIDDVIVGKNSQFANNTAVPARVFDENAVGVRLKGDTAQVSQDITLNVTNISGAAVRFRAAIIGTAVE